MKPVLMSCNSFKGACLALFASALALNVLFTSQVEAEQVMHLESVVTGNQEQPKVLFVMPWQPIPTPEYDPAQASLLMPERLLNDYTAKSLQRFSERARTSEPSRPEPE